MEKCIECVSRFNLYDMNMILFRLYILGTIRNTMLDIIPYYNTWFVNRNDSDFRNQAHTISDIVYNKKVRHLEC